MSDELWSLVEPLLPEPGPKLVAGRPRRGCAGGAAVATGLTADAVVLVALAERSSTPPKAPGCCLALRGSAAARHEFTAECWLRL
ncbi:hypothetical protein ACI2LF_40870 [Kribbella sp. NPDC020789]